MNNIICPQCNIFYFPNKKSLARHLNKCNSLFYKKRLVSSSQEFIGDDSTQNPIKKIRVDNSNNDSNNNQQQYSELEDLSCINHDEFFHQDESAYYTTKYYNWQIKIGDILFSGSNNNNNNSSTNDNTISEISTISNSTTLKSSSLSGLGSIINLGRVKDISGLFYGIPNVNDVIDIFTYAKLNMLSNSSGDELLHLLKDIIHRHSSTVEKYFIYDRIENLNGAVTRAVSQIYHGITINITLPTKLCGETPQEIENVRRILDFRNHNLEEFIIAKGNGLNIVELIAEFLIHISLDAIDFHPITLTDTDDEHFSYGRFATGDLFSHIHHEVTSQYGNDVVPICVQLSFDGTDISGGGGSKPRSSTPFHVRILNISDDIFGLQMSTILCGFAPTFTVSVVYFYYTNIPNIV